MEAPRCDLIQRLHAHLLDHLVENIFTSLDVEALLAAERVSADWRRIIDDGHVWRKFFHIKMSSLPLWRRIHDKCAANWPQSDYKQLTTRIWQAETRLRENWRTGRCRATLDERSFDVDARFHQIDERHMVYLSRSGMIDRKRLTVVRRSSMQVVQEIECPLHAFHFVGQVLVTAASDGVRFWNLTTGQLRHHLEVLQGHKVQDVLFVDGWMAVASLPGGHHSSSADVDFLVTVWRTGVDADGADRPRLQAEIPFRALHLHLQMDADFVVVVVSRSGQTSRRVHVWSTATEDVVSTFDCNFGRWCGNTSAVRYGRRLLLIAEPAGGIRIVDVVDGRCRATIATPPDRDCCLRLDDERIVALASTTTTTTSADDGGQRRRGRRFDVYDAVSASATPLLLCSLAAPDWIQQFHLDAFQLVASGIRMLDRPQMSLLFLDFFFDADSIL